MSLLVICEILGHFVNTLTADDYILFVIVKNCHNHIQMQLSKKQKTFSQFFGPFLKTKSIFERLRKKVDPCSFCISL